MPEPLYDLFDESDGLAAPPDPAQLALHGLLCVYYDLQAGLSRSRVEGILAQLPSLPRLWWLTRRRPATRWIVALAAAVVIAALTQLWRVQLEPPASAFDLRELGFSPPILVAAPAIDPDNAELVERTVAEVADYRAMLQRQLNTPSPDPDPWLPWTQVYRRLRALGRWDEAEAEMLAFLAYAEARDAEPERYSPLGMALGDLAGLYAAMGDYAQATDYRLRAFEFARNYQDWLFDAGIAVDASPRGRALALANSLVPQLWLLSELSAAQESVSQSWEYLRQAEALLRDYFALECAERGLLRATGVPLLELAQVLAAEDHTGVESMMVKVREHFVYCARLRRLDRDLAAATQALDATETLCDYPYADESRLDFNEPMERLRIAIAAGDFAAALGYAAEAERHTGAQHFPGYPSQVPIGVIARAELMFLEGAARLGVDGADQAGTQLMDLALDRIRHATRGLSPSQRASLEWLLASWLETLERIRSCQRWPSAARQRGSLVSEL